MSAYALFENIAVYDADKLEEYKGAVRAVVERFGGRYVAIGGAIDVVEGDWRPRALVMIEFPDLTAARSWYESADYRELKALRRSSTQSNGVLFEGLALSS